MTRLARLALAALAASPLLFPAQGKRRVAVINFDYGTVYSNVSAIFGSNIDVGKGVADLLVDKLVGTAVYQVIERKAIDKIMAEQNFSNSDRANPATAARLGQLLGVDAIIIGTVTQFGRDDKTTEVGGLGRLTGRYGVTGVGKREAKAVAGLTARVISVDTGEVLASASGAGESTRSGASLAAAGGSARTAAGGMYDMTSRNFASTLIGEAVNKAVATLATQLDQQATRVPERTIKVQGLVADVSGNTIVINVGSKAGVRVGDRLEIQRQNREIRDPETGRVIRRVTDAVGVLTITEVDELSAVGQFAGPMAPQVGDMVRSPSN